VVAPVLQLAGVLSPVAVLDHPAVGILGAIAGVLGIAATLWAQESMGDSWRIGVDASETTPDGRQRGVRLGSQSHLHRHAGLRSCVHDLLQDAARVTL
jgi:hypothetical protein